MALMARSGIGCSELFDEPVIVTTPFDLTTATKRVRWSGAAAVLLLSRLFLFDVLCTALDFRDRAWLNTVASPQ